MAVHVDEIHTQVATSTSGATSGAGEVGGPGPAAPHPPPGSSEDAWRRTEARIHQLRCRVAAEGFDD
jgi:hypothetical protein